MAIHMVSARVTREFLGTIFVLVNISVCGTVQAQSMNWLQYSAPQQQQYYAAPANAMSGKQFANAAPQMFQAPVQAVPAAAYQASAAQPYFVASRPASAPMPSMVQNPGMAQNQFPVTSMQGEPCYQGAPQPQYAPADQWCAPSVQGGVSYGSGYGQGYCGGSGYGMSNYGMGSYACRPPVQWFGSAGVLMLARDDENHRFFSYDSDDESYQLLDSQETNFDWSGGVEAHVGCMNLCTGCGWEAVYWGIYPDGGYAYAYPSQVSGDLNGIFNFDQLDYNGQTADNYVNGAAVHRLWRETELHNVEFNHIWDFSNRCGATSSCATGCDPCCDPCGSNPCSSQTGCCDRGSCAFRALVGFRYLRFVDNLQFASDPSDTMFTGEVDELYYDIDCDNDLFGVQVGGTGERALGASAWSVTFGAKAGVFLNDADAYSTIGGAAGYATINNGPNDGVAWNIEAHDDSVATIGELQAGIACAISPTWRLRGDYRVIGISGVALPTNQIYQDLRGIQDVALLSTNGDVILHGVFIGAERTY